MSDKPKRKESTHISGLFTIGFEDLENGGLPGITQLLSPAAMKQKALDRAKAEQDARDLAQAQAEAEASEDEKPNAIPPASKPIAKFSVTEAMEIPQKNVPITNLNFDSDEHAAAGTLEDKEFVKTAPHTPPKAPPPMPKAPPVRPISELTALIKRDITQTGIPGKTAPSAQGKPQVRIPNTPPPSELTMLINRGKITPPKQITSLEPSEIMEPSERPVSTLKPEGSQVAIAKQTTQAIDIEIRSDLHEAPILQASKPQAQSAPNANPQSLSDYGVQFELHFEAERGMYRYARMKGHKRAVLALWQQKFYFQMKLDLKALGLEAPFQEFSKDKDEFYADAFGLIEANYVQVVRLDSTPTKVYVLLSDHSLADHQSQIKDLLMGKKPNHSGVPDSDSGDDDFVIELVS